MLVRQANLEKAILEALRRTLIHRPNQIAERLHSRFNNSAALILIAVFACKPEFTRDMELEFQHVVLGTTPANVGQQSGRKRLL
jgi:hypothetical protein